MCSIGDSLAELRSANQNRLARRSSTTISVVGVVLIFLAGSVASAQEFSLRVQPARISLDAPESSAQLLVWEKDAGGSETDVTRDVVYTTSRDGVVRVSTSGRIEPIGDGKTELIVRRRELVATVEVDVHGYASPSPISFQHQVIPILSKAGCNSGGCHGKAEGQNGFKLSVFGFDSLADHGALTKDGRGRRVFPAAPEQSLLLLKATAKLPHGGGLRVAPNSFWYHRLVRWIQEGMVFDEKVVNSITGIVVEPSEVTLAANSRQQLRVLTVDDRGERRCVTAEADFQSNNEAISTVDKDGLIAVMEVPGEAAILVRYLGHVTVCRVTRPRPDVPIQRPTERNFVDGLVWNKLERLRIPPSPPADDATFLRRVFLDTIGTLPTSDEVRSYLADRDPEKRRRWTARLFERPEYADYWSQRWADVLQVDKDIVTPQGAVAITRWIRRQIQDNVPFDQFARAIMMAQGSTLSESPAAFYQVQPDAERVARSLSQLFLGVRIECAQCHHHPFERWDQKDYFALAAFFTGVERKPHPQGGIKISVGIGTNLKHPRTGQIIAAAGLGAPAAELGGVFDRRSVFAKWATSAENPYFARTIANRIWAHYLGRGLVEPVDDLRATNPASNEPLLDALANHLIELRFDLKTFSQTILDSQVYQLSSDVNPANRLDEQNYSHAAWKSLPAEVLLDAVSQVTGVPETFNGWPQGFRAIQIWDNKLPSYFLEVFGRPKRLSVCSCERGVEPSIAQALHLMNSPAVAAKIAHRDGRVAKLANSNWPADSIIEEIYLSALSRFPSQQERQHMVQVINEGASRREAIEDILWAVLNTKEFVYCR